MNIPIYQVDAFSSQAFGGNPAAVMPLTQWLDDTLLQTIAMENNLSETAFLVSRGDDYELRWFTPTVEVDLCGHATLASAHVLFEHLGYAAEAVCFHTRSGELRVTRSGSAITMDFPASSLEECAMDVDVCNALGSMASESVSAIGANKLLYIYEFEEDVAALAPDFSALLAATDCCVIATAPGDSCDFVSRFFGPQVGVNEDPVTGSAHCALVPYWASRLKTDVLQARQISARGGDIACSLDGDRVVMTGQAVTFLVGEVMLPG